VIEEACVEPACRIDQAAAVLPVVDWWKLLQQRQAKLFSDHASVEGHASDGKTVHPHWWLWNGSIVVAEAFHHGPPTADDMHRHLEGIEQSS